MIIMTMNKTGRWRNRSSFFVGEIRTETCLLERKQGDSERRWL